MAKFFKVFRAGKYPQGEVTEADVKEIAGAYDASYHEAVLNLNHDDCSPAYAIIDEVKAVGKELFVSFRDMLEDSYDMNKRYRKPSIEISEYDGKKYLRAVSMTNFPQVKGLDTLAFAELPEDVRAKLEEKKNRIFFTEGLTLNLTKGESMFSEQIVKLAESLSLNISNYSVEGDVVTAALAAVTDLQSKLGEMTEKVTSLNVSLAGYTEAGITPEKFTEVKTELDAAKVKLTEMGKTRVDELITFAGQYKNMTPAQAEGLRSFAETKYDDAKKFVDALPAKPQNIQLHKITPEGKDHTYEEVIADPKLAAQYTETELAELKKNSKTFN